ncbi:uncharacterized protein DUF2147 [Desulfobotulus alkaliphilus]|uniref:Uncharacterized protein DUF2147 n=1 Tax=Desulfobotulus alkaliphilus TaxID=622671 RepID=A0A562S7R0_9BACT|nr:DUF2147 domain-containing protein [Desulfobotulus alkaliphilus]TWI77318.1 uncharacterized protein DUF2147 [Desulfobotulus alkaliphilus]
MYKRSIPLLLFFIVLLSIPAFSQTLEPPTGLWKTEGGKSIVEIIPLPENKSWAAQIVWLKEPMDDEGEELLDALNPNPKKRNNPILGLTIAWGFRTAEKGGWKDGQVYDPENGKIYKGQARMKGDQLELRGYIGIPAFGRSTHWKRISHLPEAS